MVTAHRLVLGKSIRFNPSLAKTDDQIDFSPVFTRYAAYSRVFHTGGSDVAMQGSLMELDPRQAYFITLAQNGKAGHHQLLYFTNSGWQLYSSASNNGRATDEDCQLTEFGCSQLLARYAGWGFEEGQYALMVQEATPERVIAAANFIAALRLGVPYDEALAALYSDQPLELTEGYFYHHEIQTHPDRWFPTARAFPPALLPRFNELVLIYEGSPKDELRQQKRFFLLMLKQRIEENPQRSLSNCIEDVKETFDPPVYQAGAFGSDRVAQFLNSLLQSEAPEFNLNPLRR